MSRHCATVTLVTSEAPWPGAGEHYVTMVTRDIITICTGNVTGITPRGKVETRARHKERILQKNKCLLWPDQGELEGGRNCFLHWKDVNLQLKPTQLSAVTYLFMHAEYFALIASEIGNVNFMQKPMQCPPHSNSPRLWLTGQILNPIIVKLIDSIWPSIDISWLKSSWIYENTYSYSIDRSLSNNHWQLHEHLLGTTFDWGRFLYQLM